MENEVARSPQSPNPLRDKVIHAHADIRIDSIEDRPQPVEESQHVPLIEQNSKSEEDAAVQENAAQMQVWWEEAIAKHMGLADGYEKVAVLLIKWDDGLDELKTASETEELRALFTNQFHYHCETVELNVSSKPQHQMNRHLSNFVDAHDGPNHLMIVYYTGHGVYREDLKCLELTASLDPSQKRGFKNEARANWNKAEEHLRSDYVEGDVLTILDTCYASNLQKSGKEDTRTFELLSACAIDATTAGPGSRSFTRALIDALKELLHENQDRSFTTFHLNQRILQNPIRHMEPSQLWFRLKHHDRHIRLAPLKPPSDRRQNSFQKPPRGYLTLRFALRDDSLNREQIELLSQKLSAALKNPLLGLRKIDWLGLKPARTTHFGRAALAMYAILQWKKVIRQRREARMREDLKGVAGNPAVADVGMVVRETSDVGVPLEPGVEPIRPSLTRKRTREAEDQHQPGPKRGLLVVTSSGGNPPSPPVSVSSRVEELPDADAHVG